MAFTANASTFNTGSPPPPNTNSGDIGCSLVPGTNNTTSVTISSNTQINPYPSTGMAHNCQCFWGSLATTNYLYISGSFTPGGGTIIVTASQLNSMAVPPPNNSFPGRYFIGMELIMLHYSNQTYSNSNGANQLLPNEFVIPAPPGGSLNPYGGIQRSISFFVQPCGIPTSLSATPYQNGQVQLSWTAPTDDGGSGISSYLIQYNTTGSAPWIQINTGSSGTSYPIPSLTNGITYYFQVAAVNGYCNNGTGYGPDSGLFSSISTAIPATTPDPPPYASITTTSGVSSISVVWDTPSNTGGAAVTSYTLQYRVSGSGSSFTPIGGIQTTPTPPHYIITGLLPSTTYEIQVASVNIVGQGSFSASVLGTTDTTPDNPTNFQGNSGDQQVSLSWTTPNNDGGSSITGYLIEFKLDSLGVPPGSWTSIFTSNTTAPLYYTIGPTSSPTPYPLTNGTLYDFRVSAVNAVGTGSHSNIIELTPSTIPGPPTSISAVGCDNQQVLVTWSPPTDTGGAPILSYNLQYSTNPSGPWLPTTPFSVPPPPVSTITTSTIFDWNTLMSQPSRTFVVNNASSYQLGNNIRITYSNSDSITGTITAITGNNVTITITSFTSAPYLSTTIYTSTPVDASYFSGTLVNPVFPLNPAVSTPNPPIIPANTIITNGESYIYSVTTPVSFTINILTTSNVPIGSPSQPTTSTPPAFGSATPNLFTFTDGVFVTPAQEVRIQANTGGQSVDYGTPLGGSYVNLDFCGFLQGYTLSYSQGVIDILPITLSYPVTGLTNGTQYYFQVQAINMNGPGPYSAQTANSTATPSITPQPPIPITTTAITSTSIALSWTAPTGLANTGGNPVTGYLIYWSQVSPSGTIIPPTYLYNTTTSGTPLATTYTITGLTHATLYAVQISSISCSGFGPISSPALYVTTSSIPPSAPTNLTITGCNTGYTNSVILTWTAPANDGGSPITNYIVYYRTTSPVGTWYTYNTNSNATTAIVPLPASSTSYDFKILAQNVAGVSIFSSPIVSSSSYNPPTAPTNHTATNFVSNTSLNGSILLTWTPSTQELPQTISYYVVEYKICEFGGYVTHPTTITFPSNSVLLSNIGASSSSNIANNVPYLFRVYAVSSCGARSPLSNTTTATSYNNDEPTRLWSRFNLNCSGNITSFDSLTRNMLRKGQVLQYPVVGTLQYSRATLWSMAAKNQLTRKKAWASQSEEYIYPNTTNINNQPDVGLRQTPTSLVCWRQPPSLICNSSTASDVPGNPTTLCLSKNAPFDNFRRPITYSSGGTKFPVFFSK